MNPLETFRVALRALFRNKMRSFLTMLGIIIGVFAVIAMVAIGEGAKAKVQQSFEAMGSNLLILRSGSSGRGGASGGFGSMPSLTWDDLEAIRSEVPGLRAAAAQLRTGAQVVGDELNWTTTIYGTSPDYFVLRNWEIADGVGLSSSDVDAGTKVAVVGKTVVENLYGDSVDPIGLTIRIRNVPFTIVGVLAAKGQSGMGQDNDDAVFIPETTFRAKVEGGLQRYLNGTIMLGATSADTLPRVESATKALLRDRHRLDDGKDDDFAIHNLAEMQGAMQDSTKTLTMLLASIAMVSLLVGGIGIMNIMLVSVTERTREIGVRMAVGAKPRHILSQFLVEALSLSMAGGIVGVLLAFFGARALSSSMGWPLVFEPGIVVVAVGFSALVGAVFGLYPAFKASRLDPIEALRYE